MAQTFLGVALLLLTLAVAGGVALGVPHLRTTVAVVVLVLALAGPVLMRWGPSVGRWVEDRLAPPPEEPHDAPPATEAPGPSASGPPPAPGPPAGRGGHVKGDSAVGSTSSRSCSVAWR